MNDWRSASASFSFAAISALSACLNRGSTITGPSPLATAIGRFASATRLDLVLDDRQLGRLGALREPRALRLGAGPRRLQGAVTAATAGPGTTGSISVTCGLALLPLRRRSSTTIGVRALDDRRLDAALVVADLEHVILVDVLVLVLVVVLVSTALGEHRAEHVDPERADRERRGTERATDRERAGADRVQHVAHAQRRRDDDRDHEADAREQRGAGRADHRAQDLREVLADRAARAVPGDAIAGAARWISVASETTPISVPAAIIGGITGSRSISVRTAATTASAISEVAAHAGEPVEQPGDRAPERSHHQPAGLQRDHRDEQEQRRAQPDHAHHLATAIGAAARVVGDVSRIFRFLDIRMWHSPELPYPTCTDIPAQTFRRAR